MTPADIKALILDVPDFPKPGIVFKDITPVLENPPAFRAAIGHLARRCDGLHADEIGRAHV